MRNENVMTQWVRMSVIGAAAVAFAGVCAARDGAEPEKPAADAAVEVKQLSGAAKVRADAERLAAFAQSALAKRFLAATAALPEPETRTLYVNRATRKWYTAAERGALGEADRAALTERVMDSEFYYSTRYGSPLAYVRALDLIAAKDAGGAGGFGGASGFVGKRVIDYGYGKIGHLRLMASCGATVVGLETDSSLELLYGKAGDTGRIAGVDGAPEGEIVLRTGRFPVDVGCSAAELLKIAGAANEREGVEGGGFDLFISKNTLKNGYIHPAQEVDKRMLVDLGTDEASFLNAVAGTLKPGGLFMIYNLSPAPSKPGEPYKPWSDGRSPFSREQFEAAGFEVVVIDENDDKAARVMGKLLGWADDPDGEGPQTGMDLEGDLFAHWTLVRKR